MMYEAFESPKICPRCRSAESTVKESYLVDAGKVKRRKRVCNNCDKMYITNTPKDSRFI